MTVTYSEAYPGTGQFQTVPCNLFINEGLKVTYYAITDFSGPMNQTCSIPNISTATNPLELSVSWPQVFSSVYEGTFKPNTSGTYHFSLSSQGLAILLNDRQVVANILKANFGNTVQVIVSLKAGDEVSLSLNYSMGYTLSIGACVITLGLNVGNEARDEEAISFALQRNPISASFSSRRGTTRVSTAILAPLSGVQDAMIYRVAQYPKKNVVILNTCSAVLLS